MNAQAQRKVKLKVLEKGTEQPVIAATVVYADNEALQNLQGSVTNVDGLAELTKIEAQPRTRKYYFKAPAEILSGIVEKGSVCLDGVSLTVIDAAAVFFSVGVIPTTLADTTLAELKIGDSVNVETDMIGKYVMKFMKEKFSGQDKSQEMKNSLTWDKLVEYGWA